MADETSNVGLNNSNFLQGIDQMISRIEKLNKSARSGDQDVKQLLGTYVMLARDLRKVASEQKAGLDPSAYKVVIQAIQQVEVRLASLMGAVTKARNNLAEISDIKILEKTAQSTVKNAKSITDILRNIRKEYKLTQKDVQKAIIKEQVQENITLQKKQEKEIADYHERLGKDAAAELKIQYQEAADLKKKQEKEIADYHERISTDVAMELKIKAKEVADLRKKQEKEIADYHERLGTEGAKASQQVKNAEQIQAIRKQLELQEKSNNISVTDKDLTTQLSRAKIIYAESVLKAAGNEEKLNYARQIYDKTLTNITMKQQGLTRELEITSQREEALSKGEFLITGVQKYEQYSSDIRNALVLKQQDIVKAFQRTGLSLDVFESTVQGLRKGTVKITPEMRDLTQKVAAFDRQVRSADTSLQGFTFSISNLSRLVVARIVTAVFYRLWNQMEQTVQTATDLSKAIGEIQTISQASALTNDQWAASIRKVSDAYNLTQLDVAEGLYQTISNQVATGKDAMTFMEKAAPFAKATKSTMTDTVELLSSVLNSYNLRVEDMDTVTASLFKTIELGRVRAADMANTFGRIGGIAEISGISLNELLGTIIVLTRSGLKFERASTFILNVMNKLVKPSKEMQQLFTSWGVTSGQAAIQMFGLTGVVDRLGQASDGMVGELAESLRDLRATLGGITLVRNADRFRSSVDQLANSFEYYDNAVNIAMASSGEVVTKELLRLKNDFISFSTFLLDTTADVSKAITWDLPSGRIGGISGLLKAAVGVGIAFGPSALLSFKFKDNINVAQTILKTMPIRPLESGMLKLSKATKGFAGGLGKGLTTLRFMGPALSYIRDGFIGVFARFPGYLSLIAGAAMGIYMIERRILDTSAANTKLNKSLQDAYDNARKLLATPLPDKQITEEQEKHKKLIAENEQQQLRLNHLKKQAIELVEEEGKAQQKNANAQKENAKVIQDLARDLGKFQQEEKFGGMLPLPKMVAQLSDLQQQAGFIQQVPEAQRPVLTEALRGQATETYKNYKSLLSDMGKVEQFWTRGMMFGDKDQIGQAQSLLEKWNIMPTEFGPMLFDSIRQYGTQIEGFMNQMLTPLFAGAGMQIPEQGVGAFGDLSQSLQLIAASDARITEIESQTDTTTNIYNYLKTKIGQGIYTIAELLASMEELTTKDQDTLTQILSTSSTSQVPNLLTFITENEKQIEKGRKEQYQLNKGTAESLKRAFIIKYAGDKGPIAQAIKIGQTIVNKTGDPATQQATTQLEGLAKELELRPETIYDPAIQNKMVQGIIQLNDVATQAATSFFGLGNFLSGTAWTDYNDELMSTVQGLNRLYTEMVVNFRGAQAAPGTNARVLMQPSLEQFLEEKTKFVQFTKGIKADNINIETKGITFNGQSGPNSGQGALGGFGGQGLATGGQVYGPKGTDTVPAWLTPNEFVVNAKAAQKHAPLLHAINAGYYAKGGEIEVDEKQLKKYKELAQLLKQSSKNKNLDTISMFGSQLLQDMSMPYIKASKGTMSTLREALEKGKDALTIAKILVPFFKDYTYQTLKPLVPTAPRMMMGLVPPRPQQQLFMPKSNIIQRPERILKEVKKDVKEITKEELPPRLARREELRKLREKSLEEQFKYFDITQQVDRKGEPLKQYKEFNLMRLEKAYSSAEEQRNLLGREAATEQETKDVISQRFELRQLKTKSLQEQYEFFNIKTGARDGILPKGLETFNKERLRKAYDQADKQRYSAESMAIPTPEQAEREALWRGPQTTNGQNYWWDGIAWRSDQEWRDLYWDKMQEFATGGNVSGPKGTDTVPAWLTPGEFVINAKATQNYRSLLERINSFGTSAAPLFQTGTKQFANGGPVATNNYQIKNDITLQSTGQETIDARRLVTAINREVYRGTLQVRTS